MPIASCPLSAFKPSLPRSAARFRFALRWFAAAVALLASASAARAQLAVPLGQTSEVQSAAIIITTAGTPSAINVVTQGAPNLDFKFASGGSCTTTGYQFHSVCTVFYTFTPAAAGQRLGAVTLTNGSTVLGITYLRGIGIGPQVAFSPGTQSTLNVKVGVSGLSYPAGVAVDAAGDLFIADPGNNRLVEVPVGGGALKTIGSGLSDPWGVAVDGAGDVFFADPKQSSL